MRNREYWLFGFAAISASAGIVKILEYFNIRSGDWARFLTPHIPSVGPLAWGVTFVAASTGLYLYGLHLARARSRIAVKLVDAIFDHSDLTSSHQSSDGQLITETMAYIALVVEFTSFKSKSATIDKVSLSIQMPSGDLEPKLLSELGPEPSRVELRSPTNIRELEPNVLVTNAITVTRYIRFAFNQREGRDDGFEQKGIFSFTAIDSLGIEHRVARPPGPWPSDPAQQMLRRYGSRSPD